MVYPSNNLSELSLLPKPIFHAIKNYRTKVIGSGDRDIYVKITSSLLDWDEEEYFLPYHWIEVGLAKKDVRFELPQAKKITEDVEELATALKPSRLRNVYRKYTEIFSDSKKRVNYCNNKVVVISNFPNITRSPHFSPAFMVNKLLEQKRGKKRMVVNYEMLNDHTKGDGYLLPNKEQLLQ